MNVSLNAKMNKVYMDKMCGFLNVLHIYQKQPSESVREQGSDINNELRHGNIFMHNGSS